MGDMLPDRPVRYYHFYDKGSEGLVDGEIHRYVIDDDGVRFDRRILSPRPDPGVVIAAAPAESQEGKADVDPVGIGGAAGAGSISVR
jgi:hypothetical protein